MRRAVLPLLAASLLLAQTSSVSSARIRAHVRFLSSDLLEGRGVGSRGGDLATEYIATQFELSGLEPAGDHGTYFERVPLVGAATDPRATLSASRDGLETSFQWLDDFVGVSELQQAEASIDGEALFVGHGIDAPEFHWDDYAGADVHGKVLVMFTNEPPSSDPKFFAGPALTYYGRWTYKYEEAARRGASAVFLLYTPGTAGYGYGVVRSSWGKEDPQIRLAAGQPALAFAGWLSQGSAEKLAVMAGTTLDALLRAADTPGFRPMPLDVRLHGSFPTRIRTIESRNVAAIVTGSDPKLKEQAVVFSAHWDHLGIGDPVDGDSIYNGAVDNATGCGVLLEIARAWAAQPVKPKRSALFLALTAEEAGLRGSEYFGRHPLIPASKLALDLNYDALYPFGRTADVSVTGAERTTVWPLVQTIARGMHLEIAPDPQPGQGHYYRSDHFSFARFGVPAFSIGMGTRFIGKSPDFGSKVFNEYVSRHYHQPSDQFDESWDFAGMEQMARFGMEIGIAVANQPTLPGWRPGDEFFPAREHSLAAAAR